MDPQQEIATVDPVKTRRALRRAEIAVFVIFVLNGFNFANWAARIPTVRDGLGLTPAQMGLLLFVGSVGSLAALPLSGLLIQRLGARRAVVTFAAVNGAGLLVAALGLELDAVVVVGAGALVFSVGTSVWDAAMNLEGAEVERRRGVTIMPRLHGGFSLGTMAGAGVGALAAGLDVPLLPHFLLALSLSFAGVLFAVRAFLAESDLAVALRTEQGAGTKRAKQAFATWLEPRTLLIGLVVLSAALTEGAANDWVSLAVVDGFGVSNSSGALTFGLFVTAMTAVRFLGGSLLDRFGRVVVLRLVGAAAIVGLLLFTLPAQLWVALIGVVVWGGAAALGFPIGISAAADDPLRAAPRVSVVATIGYSAFLVGPPLLGLLAQHVGYRLALLAIAGPVLLGLAVARVAAPVARVGAINAGRAASPS